MGQTFKKDEYTKVETVVVSGAKLRALGDKLDEVAKTTGNVEVDLYLVPNAEGKKTFAFDLSVFETKAEEKPAETPAEETPAAPAAPETPAEKPAEETPVETPAEEAPAAPAETPAETPKEEATKE